MKYTVNYWGSRPGRNDDCWTGQDFETKAEALAFFDSPIKGFYELDTAWIEADGPDLYRTRPNPAYEPENGTEDDWQREMQSHAAMAYGIAGYNDWA